MAERTDLPNGCWIGKMSVYPPNWNKPGASLKRPWRISYYFHDPLHKDRYPYGKLCPVANMNQFKTLTRRQQETADILKQEKKMLVEEGYNPITGLFKVEEEVPTVTDLPPTLLFTAALLAALPKIAVSDGMKDDMRCTIRYTSQAIAQLGLSGLQIGQVTKKHINAIMDHLALHKPPAQHHSHGWSAYMHNKYLKHLRMLFKKLEAYEAVPANPVLSVERKKTFTPTRQVLTDAELTIVSNHIKNKDYPFYVFLGCFFPSGSRESELHEVKGKDVNLETGYFTRTIKKGGVEKPAPTIITAGALPYWQEAMQGCGPDDYVFSTSFKPGITLIDKERVHRRWNKLVKRELGINKDAYPLKHLFLTKVTTKEMDDLKQARKLAARHAGHTTTDMIEGVYDVEKNRLDEALKENKEGFR